jgi:hypothetical protein
VARRVHHAGPPSQRLTKAHARSEHVGKVGQSIFCHFPFAFAFGWSAGFETLCFGPLLTAASTARSNRSQPSGRSSMDTPEDTSPVASEHMLGFGAIIHLFARHERLMIGVMGRLMNAHPYQVAQITAELPYRGKRETLIAMIKQATIDPKHVERVCWFLGELHKHSHLRNSIAHSAWKAGGREGAIKPLAMSIRGGQTAFKGMDDAETDYTASDLLAVAMS